MPGRPIRNGKKIQDELDKLMKTPEKFTVYTY